MKSIVMTNYQKYDLVEYKDKICEVIAVLDCLGLDLHADDETEYYNVYMGDVNPIPITIEILKKIGFTHVDLTDSEDLYIYDDVLTRIAYHFLGNSISIKSKTTNITKTGVFHVSDMQHCLNLAEREFIITKEILIDKNKE